MHERGEELAESHRHGEMAKASFGRSPERSPWDSGGHQYSVQMRRNKLEMVACDPGFPVKYKNILKCEDRTESSVSLHLCEMVALLQDTPIDLKACP